MVSSYSENPQYILGVFVTRCESIESFFDDRCSLADPRRDYYKLKLLYVQYCLWMADTRPLKRPQAFGRFTDVLEGARFPIQAGLIYGLTLRT